MAEFLDRVTRIDHVSVEHALASGQLQAALDSYSVPRARWVELTRALRAHEAIYKEAMGFSVLKNAPKSPRQLHRVEVVGRVFVLTMFAMIATGIVFAGLALFEVLTR